MFESLISQIVSHFNPIQIVLFGSFAKGDYHKDSDIDLCIVAETKNKINTLADMYNIIESDRPVDIILYTPEEWLDLIQDPGSFAFQINKQGIGLFKRPQAKHALSENIEKSINCIVADMNLEGMILSEEEKENLRKIGRGEITYEEHLQKITEKGKALGKK